MTASTFSGFDETIKGNPAAGSDGFLNPSDPVILKVLARPFCLPNVVTGSQVQTGIC